MLWTILILLVVAVVALAAFIATRPDIVNVKRETTIKAPPPRIFDEVNDLRRFNDWSPWSDMDPNARIEFSEKEQGESATLSWEGNSKVGKGSLAIVGTESDRAIHMRLRMVKPFPCDNPVLFSFEPQGDATRVTWSMECEQTTCSKAMSLFMNLDRMLGKEYEKGLANLKQRVEQP